MDELRSVTVTNSFGTVSVHLRELLEAKGITRYRMAKLANTRFEVVDKWCTGAVERIDSDILARFCYILDCEVQDLVQYNK